MYFDKFPQIAYSFNVNGKSVTYSMVDITINVRVLKSILSNITLYDLYAIQDGETPDILSQKIYGSPQYHWVIMLANDKFDYLADFPLTQLQLEQYLTDKYGEGHELDTHHYELNGFVVNSTEPGAFPVSNADYETAINEQKRIIKVISPSLLSTVLSQLETILK